MLNEAIQERLEEIETICDKLPYLVANNGWNDEVLKLFFKLQKLAVILDDEDDDADITLHQILSEMRETDQGRFVPESVGVYVVKDGRVLCGIRITETGFGMLCGPGGYVDEGETPEQAAIREAKEEFGITPKSLIPFGRGVKGERGMRPHLFLCTEYDGEPECDDQEMTRPMFLGMMQCTKDRSYAPFADGVKRLLVTLLEDDKGNKQMRADEKPKDWITINGTHVPVDENGDIHGRVAEKITRTGAMNPSSTDYEYSDGDTRDEWVHKNASKLKPLYKSGGSAAIDSEFRKFCMARVTKDIHEISKADADAVMYDHVRQSIYDGWFRNADSSYKPKLIDSMLESQEMRNAGLSLAYENYKNSTDNPIPFDKFLTTPISMYRGEHGQKHIEDDVFDAYTFDRKTAEYFAGKDGTVTEKKIRPIDTYGSMRAVGEAEIWVPSEIASSNTVEGKNPSKNVNNHEKTVETPEESQYNNIRMEFAAAIDSGAISSKLQRKKQRKHREGSNEYKKAVAKGEFVSTVDLSDDEVQNLIMQYSGKGTVYENNGQFKETFTHTRVIGTYFDRKGNSSPTKRGTIHYAKDGAHLVPASPGDGGKE